MVYNQDRSFAVARLRGAARECGVRKKLLKLKGTASRGQVAEVWEACQRKPGPADGKERARRHRPLPQTQGSGQTSGIVLWGGKSVGGLG